jgi:hypothetical protein
MGQWGVNQKVHSAEIDCGKAATKSPRKVLKSSLRRATSFRSGPSSTTSSCTIAFVSNWQCPDRRGSRDQSVIALTKSSEQFSTDGSHGQR